MPTERQKLTAKVLALSDLLLTVAAFIAAYLIKKYILPEPFRGLTTAPNYYTILMMIIIIWYVILSQTLKNFHARSHTLGPLIWEAVSVVAKGVLVLSVALYALKIRDVSRIMIGIFVALDIILLVLRRLIYVHIYSRMRNDPQVARQILMIGTRERAKDIIETLLNDRDGRYWIVGCLDPDPEVTGQSIVNGIKVLGRMDDLAQILRNRVVDEVVFAMPLTEIRNAEQHIGLAEQMGVAVRIVPDWQIHALKYQPRVASVHFGTLAGVPVLSLVAAKRPPLAALLKGLIDKSVATTALIILAPLMLFISLMIKVVSPGPVFFKQVRSGLNGRRFTLYKFRTMTSDAEDRLEELRRLNEADGPVFKIRKDPRIIPLIGSFLRKHALDELPQLINIVKGEMSLVGPRPPIPAEVDHYLDTWRRRLSMKPGLTCLWQVTNQRNEMAFDDWVKLDLEYIDKWSLSLDMRIIFLTAKAVLTGQGR